MTPFSAFLLIYALASFAVVAHNHATQRDLRKRK